MQFLVISTSRKPLEGYGFMSNSSRDTAAVYEFIINAFVILFIKSERRASKLSYVRAIQDLGNEERIARL